MVETECVIHASPPKTEVSGMGTYDRSEIFVANGSTNYCISGVFDTGEREKSIPTLPETDIFDELHTMTDNLGRVYMITDILMKPADRTRQINVIPIDLDGKEF